MQPARGREATATTSAGSAPRPNRTANRIAEPPASAPVPAAATRPSALRSANPAHAATPVANDVRAASQRTPIGNRKGGEEIVTKYRRGRPDAVASQKTDPTPSRCESGQETWGGKMEQKG